MRLRISLGIGGAFANTFEIFELREVTLHYS